MGKLGSVPGLGDASASPLTVATAPSSVPWRWRLAGLLRRAPEFRGRDWFARLLPGRAQPPDGVHEGVFGPGLYFRVRYRDDDSLVELFFLQFEQPSLAPILGEALQRGGTFFDVGANIGIYAA